MGEAKRRGGSERPRCPCVCVASLKPKTRKKSQGGNNESEGSGLATPAQQHLELSPRLLPCGEWGPVGHRVDRGRSWLVVGLVSYIQR